MSGKVLVTGDMGYIGSVLVPRLLENNFDVLGFDTGFYGTDTTTVSYPSIRKDIRLVEKKDIEGIDSIIHLSALSNDPMGDMDESLTQEINYKSTVRLAEIAKSLKVKRFIFSSSCSIYGIAESDYVNEQSPVNPLTAYAKSKISCENELSKMATPEFFVGLMRNSTVYGYSPNFRDDLVVNNLVVNALRTNEIRVMSDGSPWRPLIDVRDLADFFMRFLVIDDERLNGNVVNIGFAENNFQVKDIVDIIHKQLPSCRVLYTGEHGKDSRSYKVSFDLLYSIIEDIKQVWTMEKSVADLIRKIKNIILISADNRFTRIRILKNLIEQNKLNSQLFWL